MTYKKKLGLFIASVFVLSGCSTTEEPRAEDTTQTNQADVTSEIEETEPKEPELLFTTESEYHRGEIEGFKSYENDYSFSYEKRFENLEDLFNQSTSTSRPMLSDALTKVDEPVVFYVTDSFRGVDRSIVEYVLIFHENMLTNYALSPNNYADTHPETVLKLEDFIGKSAEEVAALADETQKRLFELTREEIISENQENDELVFQYSQMDYISPEPQPFELLFSDNYPGAQVIRKYSKILLQNYDSEYELMNEQLEDFNDYQVTYNLLMEDQYSSLGGPKDMGMVYFLGFTTGETAFVTIYDGRESDGGFKFDNERTSGINTQSLNLSW